VGATVDPANTSSSIPLRGVRFGDDFVRDGGLLFFYSGYDAAPTLARLPKSW